MAGFQVTTEYDENSGRGMYGLPMTDDDFIERPQVEEDEDDFPCTESDESDSDDTAEPSLFNRRRRELLRHIRDLEEADWASSAPRHYPEFDSPNQDLLTPNARFYIERSKSMVSIKFDPPPYVLLSKYLASANHRSSGRFILIKLWSPHTGGNIDIQSVIAHGFAGPRFFPAGSLR